MPEAQKLEKFNVSSARVEELNDGSYVVEVHYEPKKRGEEAPHFMDSDRYSAPNLDKALALIREAYRGASENSNGARKFANGMASRMMKSKKQEDYDEK